MEREYEKSNNSISPSHTSTITSKNNFVRLNVGGMIYCTTRSTLCSGCGNGENFFTSLFRNMKTGMETTTDDQGNIFIDRNGFLFSFILEYLRNGVLDVPQEHVAAINRELLFYSLPIPKELTDTKDNEVVNKDPLVTPIASLPTVRQWAIIKCTSSFGNTWIVTSSSFSKEYYGINGWIEALNSLSSKGYQLHKFYQHDILDKQTIWMYADVPSHKHH
eukprot:TRINITY_DN382_c8_g1_i1.p1 TRINITY_DN382_c8_g1~~TRINITY_DN382_c8_g1_i1.p1  ORF type:complete len:219 (-),score=42.26 TRINITY_DN382_c8_g1_i1:10-666(-)